MSKKAVFKIHIKGSIEDVWHEITKTDTLQKCMFNSRLHTQGLKPGAKIAMRTESGKRTMVVGDVLEYDPPKRYAHTFRFTLYDDPPCKVIYDLVERDGGVDFTLTVDDMPEGTKTAKDMTAGGDAILKTLKAVVETQKLPLGTRIQFLFFKIFEAALPKRTLSENWPV